MTNEQLNLISTCIIALANLPNGNEQIQNLLKNCMPPANTQKAATSKNKTSSQNVKKRRRGRPTLENNTFKLSTKEILYMPKKIQKLFAYDDKLISYRFHKGVFEAHYRRNGLDIYASSKDFQEMKRKFIELLSRAQPIPMADSHSTQKYSTRNDKFCDVLFVDYVEQWLTTKKSDR